jgi:hypothetical protein
MTTLELYTKVPTWAALFLFIVFALAKNHADKELFIQTRNGSKRDWNRSFKCHGTYYYQRKFAGVIAIVSNFLNEYPLFGLLS